MNKLEQVSSDHHQMSLVRGRSPGLMSGGLALTDLRGVPGTCTPIRVQLLSVSCRFFWGKLAK